MQLAFWWLQESSGPLQAASCRDEQDPALLQRRMRSLCIGERLWRRLDGFRDSEDLP